jgi:hypothetical protein
MARNKQTMNYYISYATNNWKNSQKFAENKAYENGADKVISYGPENLENDFVKKNIKILSNSKGGGLWLWKPYLILKTLQSINEGDKLIYCDSGMYPIQNLKYMFDLVENKDIALFQVHEKKIKDWTHEKCLEICGCNAEIKEKEQVCGAPQVYKKTINSINFVKQVLESCKNHQAISDFGSPTHRHDQSILSILAYQKEIEIYRDPSQWGNNFQRANSTYPQIFNLHRGKL